MVNSTIPEEIPEGAENPANAGDGLKVLAVEQKPVSGVDTEGLGNVASAYVTLKEKATGKSLGTYLVSQYFSLGRDMPQQVSLNGKTYNLYLRYKRTYKPYTIYLKDFRHDIYPGTEIPKNFSSDVRLTDPSRDVNREVTIWMNNPLRYEGETFYQSGVLGRDEGTVLQVVRNPGWEMPYVSCVMVSLGMLVHFGMNLLKFTKRRATA